MKVYRYIVVLVAAVVLAGCGVKKRVQPMEDTDRQNEPAWQTCLIQDARGTVKLGDTELTANVTMQTVRDSMLVISIMPMVSLEMVRVEATPEEVIVINKIAGTYTRVKYTDVNRYLVPTVSWNILQQLCTAELPTGNNTARMMYSLGDKTIELTLDYPERLINVPVRVSHVRLDRYKRMDL